MKTRTKALGLLCSIALVGALGTSAAFAADQQDSQYAGANANCVCNNAGCGASAGNGVCARSGACYIDADGDGVCDDSPAGTCAESGNGCGMGNGYCRTFHGGR